MAIDSTTVAHVHRLHIPKCRRLRPRENGSSTSMAWKTTAMSWPDWRTSCLRGTSGKTATLSLRGQSRPRRSCDRLEADVVGADVPQNSATDTPAPGGVAASPGVHAPDPALAILAVHAGARAGRAGSQQRHHVVRCRSMVPCRATLGRSEALVQVSPG